jgi:AraC-like DNA-binding protein
VPPRERTALWRESMHVLFGGLRTDFYGDAVCAGRLVASDLGPLPIARLEASRHSVYREAGRPGDSHPGYLKIVAPFEGEAWVYQHDRRAVARPGEWVAYDTTEPYVVENPVHVDHLVLMVPREVIAHAQLGVHTFMARTLSARGVSRLALDAMRSAHTELPHLVPHLAQSTASMVSELVRLSLLQLGGECSPLDRRLALRDRALRYIEQRLGDPSLSVGRISVDLGCSKRVLHEAFEGHEDSLSAHILRRRIEACARDFDNPQLVSRPIHELAMDHGFSNASHFSRAFRQQMGMSPRAYRQRRAIG